MKKNPKQREWRLNIRLTEPEYQQIDERRKKTTCRSISEYARTVLIKKPVRTIYRNQSIDDMMTGVTKLSTICQEHFDTIDRALDRISPFFPYNLEIASIFDQIRSQQLSAKNNLEQILSITSKIIDNAPHHKEQPKHPEDRDVQ